MSQSKQATEEPKQVSPEGSFFRYRVYPGWMNYVPRVIAIALTCYVILYLFDVFGRLKLFIADGEHNALFLMGILVLVFLLVPPTRSARRDRLPWYDFLFVLASIGVTLYFYVGYATLTRTVAMLAPSQGAIAILTFIVIAEATRRTLGWSMIILAAALAVFALTSSYMPSVLRGAPVEPLVFLGYTYLSPDGVMGNITTIASTVLIAFLVFAAFLQVGGGSEFFIRLALAMFGRMRGGPAKVAVVASALFGTISGSPVANAGVTGAFTIPMMKRLGYKPHFAGAVEGVSATGGTIMPPVMAVTAFIMADFMQVSYTVIAVAAIVPAVLYFLSLFIQVDREAALLGLKGLPPEEVPSLRKTLIEGWYFAVPFGVLVVLMFLLNYPAEEAALYSAASLVVVSFFRKKDRLNVKRTLDALESASTQMVSLGPMMALTGVLTASFTVTGFMIAFSGRLVDVSGGSLLVLGLLSAVVSYLLGLGLSITITYVLLAILVAPAWIAMGLPPMVAHMFLLYMGASSFITPPVAPPIYVTAMIADAPMFKTGWTAMRLGIVVYLVPFIFLFRPALLLIGSPLEVTLAIVLSIIGIAIVAASLAGYLFRKIDWPDRVLLFAGGFMITWPEWRLALAGVVMLAIVVVRQFGAKMLPGRRGATPA